MSLVMSCMMWLSVFNAFFLVCMLSDVRHDTKTAEEIMQLIDIQLTMFKMHFSLVFKMIPYGEVGGESEGTWGSGKDQDVLFACVKS